ncbi:hypothetical protein TWF281_001758 [Arthrobotrys megalospora]
MASTISITADAVPPAPISPELITLPSELLHSVVSYLKRREVCCIIRVCKRLRSIAEEHLWENLKFGDLSGNYGADCIGHKGWGALIQRNSLSSTGKVPNIPWNWVRTVSVCGADPLRDIELMKMLESKITEGRLKPQHVELDVAGTKVTRTSYQRHITKFDCANDFLLALKTYASKQSIHQFSYSLRGGSILFYGDQPIAFENVTNLVFDGELNCYPEIMYRPAGTKSIAGLIKLLSATFNLRQLSLCVRRSTVNPLRHAESLGNIQNTLNKLHNLVKLRIGGEFFHRSFFLIPPPNLRTLKLECKVTPRWWVEFSKCPLPKVEHLVLKCDDLDFDRSRRRQTFEENAGILFDEDGKFQIEDLAITTLKDFRGVSNPSWPSDLFDLVLKRNPGLCQKAKRRILSQRVRPRLVDAVSRLERRMIETTNLFVEEYGQKLEQNMEDGELEMGFLKESLELMLKEIEDGRATKWRPAPRGKHKKLRSRHIHNLL